MEVGHLVEFLALADSCNFTKVARSFNISQPGLSKHIVGLEEGLEVQLFDRSVQPVRLTAWGKAFVPAARRVVESYDSALYLLDSIRHKHPVSLTCAFVRGYRPSEDLYRTTVENLSRTAPLYELACVDIGNQLPTDNLATGAADLLIAAAPDRGELEGLHTEYLFCDPIVAVVCKDDPLACLERVTAHDLARREIFLTPQPKFAGFSRQVRDAFAALGLAPDYRPAYWYNLTDYSPIDAEDGVLMLPHGTAFLSAPASSLSGYKVLQIDSPGFVLDMNVTCRACEGVIDEPVGVVLDALRQAIAATDPALLVGRAG